MKPTLLYITTANREEAISISLVLVQEHLVACANVMDGATSIYRWQGEIEQLHEAVIIAKTAEHLVQAIIERVKSLHSYSSPCILSLPVTDGNPAFLQWIENNLPPPTID